MGVNVELENVFKFGILLVVLGAKFHLNISCFKDFSFLPVSSSILSSWRLTVSSFYGRFRPWFSLLVCCRFLTATFNEKSLRSVPDIYGLFLHNIVKHFYQPFGLSALVTLC